MAAILEDDDLIAQAQERERARLEEEAAILAFQQQQQAEAIRLAEQQRLAPIRIDDPPHAPAIRVINNDIPLYGQIQDAPAAPAIPVEMPRGNFMSQPTAEIDAMQAQFNAPPPMPRQMIGDEQYMNEVARAQRGSGFVNALVDPGGNVTVPGYDPSRDFAALKAQQEATNLQRNQYVNSLVQGGATYAEAFRAGQGRYPQAGNESMRMRVEQLAQRQNRQPFTPEVVTLDGVRVLRTGPNSAARIPEISTRATKAVMPPDTVANQKVITSQIAETRKELARAKKELEEQPRNVDAARRGNIYQQRLTELEKALVQGSTNWMGSAQAPAIQPQALTADVARELLKTAGGDKAKARKMALDAGYRL